MNTGQLLDYLKHNPDFASNVTHWQVMPARPAKYDDFPTVSTQRCAQCWNRAA